MADVESQEVIDNTLRISLQSLLDGGLKVDVEPRAYEHEQILRIISRLQSLDSDDYTKKLVISGFTLDPYQPPDTKDSDDAQACDTCMYYKVHRKFCELPELMVPVEPEWSCVLWRI